MQIIHTIAEIRSLVTAWRREGQRVGLVPTMGALHAGHLSLVEASRISCAATVVTIFVNPTQFGPNEDFSKYPRTLDADLAALAPFGVGAVFVPSVEAMYPPGATAYVDAGTVAEPLEGACRPGHFRGVATIVLKLFNAIPADAAFFGQKDYQQTLVVRRMVADLDVPIEIVVCPIVRDPDGLAKSSRNVYLSPSERKRALSLSRALRHAEMRVAAGERRADVLLAEAREILAQAGVDSVDYIALADPETLAPIATLQGPAVLAIAARVGKTRLIDNTVRF